MKRYCFDCMNEITSGGRCPYCMSENIADNVVYRLKPGTVLNNQYLVGNCLGEGGFGITYIGRDLRLDIRIAIKEYYPNGFVSRVNTLNQEVTATTESQKEFFLKGKENFLEEARKIARFSNEPGIVDIKSYFEANGTAYIIMEYLDGENLASYIKTHGVIAPRKMFELMLPITHSLQNIHKSGVIHRDISPDNIMYLKNGALKLMDFGSARYFTNETKTMSVVLKKGYAPCEQYSSNGHQGEWTDVYGLCATMYRCITGVVPEDALDRLMQDELKRPSELGVDISKDMEDIIMYGMAVRKEDRCRDMKELSQYMETALKNQHVSIGYDQRSAQGFDPQTDDSNKTVYADDYRTRAGVDTQSGGYRPPVDNSSGKSPVPPSPADTNVKVVVAVVIVAILVIAAVAGTLIYLFSDDGGDGASDTSYSSSVSGDSKDKEDDTVIIPSCTGKSLSSASDELEKLEIVVNTDYKYSDTVEKDKVIEQDLKAGESVRRGSVINLTVSKGSEHNPDGYDQKLTVSASSGSSYADAVLYEWSDGAWKEIASYDAVVGRNGIGAPREGSSTSPEGVYKLGMVLSRSKLSDSMDWYQLTNNTVIGDTPGSANYNIVTEGGSGDTSFAKNSDLLAAIFIEFNGNGRSSEGVVSGRGSAIALCGVYGGMSPTYGDVLISASDMEDLLSRLQGGKNPMIELTTD